MISATSQIKNMKRVFCLLSILLTLCSSAQDNPANDTISLARNSAYSKKFGEADRLLTLYNAHNNDVNALRLHAQVLYWMKDFKEAKNIYERALYSFPENANVKLEYGRLLYQLQKFYKAGKLLNDYLATDSSNVEAHQMLAYINLWTGHMTNAKKEAVWIKNHEPENNEAAYILNQVAFYTAPYIKLQGLIYSDDQPIQRQGFEPEAGVYKSWWLSPYIKTSLNNFDADKQYKTSWTEFGNKISLAPAKLQIESSIGYFQGSNFNGDITWKVKLTQKISSSVSLDASTEKAPYQYTLASIKTPFLYQLSEAGLSLDNKNHWLGRIAFHNQGFDDGNNCYTAYFWLLAPIIHKNDFSIKAGYAFSYANSEWNTFQPKQPIAMPLVLNKEVDGIYEPYFTPNEQTIHSLLASVYIPFSKTAGFSSNLNAGISAHASQPDLVVSRNGVGPLFIKKTYEDFQYNPIDFSGELHFKLSSNLFFNANYNYKSLIFFKAHTVNVQLKYLFTHA